MTVADGAPVVGEAGSGIGRELLSGWNRGLSELLTIHAKSARPWKILLSHAERETLLYDAQSNALLGRFGTDEDAGSLAHLKAAAGRLASRSEGVLIRLVPELVFDHSLRIPAGARDVADAIVRNQIERISPWPEAETVYGYAIAEGEAASAATIEVRVAATSTAVISQAIDQARKLGLEPSAIDSAHTVNGAGILLRSLRPDRSDKYVRAVNSVLGAALILSLVAGSVGAYASWDRMVRLDAATSELARINQRIDEVDKRSRETSQVQSSRLAILRRKISEPAVMTLVETLSRVLPVDVHLTDLTIQGQQARMLGRAVDATSLIATLENTREFENVTFSAPTLREKGTNLETFSIVATTKAPLNASAAP